MTLLSWMAILELSQHTQSGEKELDNLIYSFLLRSGYPRASIVFDLNLLDPANRTSSKIKDPTFVVVDPETAVPLAVIEVVGAVDNDALKDSAIQAGAYASELAGKRIQGYVIRVDAHGQTEADQVQFYRIWPNSTLQKLSSKHFPDIDALRVSRKLIENSAAKALGKGPDAMAQYTTPDALTIKDSAGSSLMGAGLYLPALALLLLVVIDALLTTFNKTSWLSVPQSILILGAAVLLTLPAAIRYSKR